MQINSEEIIGLSIAKRVSCLSSNYILIEMDCVLFERKNSEAQCKVIGIYLPTPSLQQRSQIEMPQRALIGSNTDNTDYSKVNHVLL